MPPNTRQMLAINQEFRNSVRLIHAGLGQLQAIEDRAADFLHLPLLTLASGFERLMKVALCFRTLEQTKSFPISGFIPAGRDGHDLKKLLQMVCEKCFLEPYMLNIPIASIDFNFIKSEQVSRFIALLSDFGQADRYYFMDIVVERANSNAKDPEQAWRAIELLIASDDPMLLEAMNDVRTFDNVRSNITIQIVATLERLVRAIARLFTIGGIGSEAKASSVYLQRFLTLRDDELGKTRYSTFGIS